MIKIIESKKFKNTLVSVRFLSPLKQDDIVAKILLANMINDVCEKYDTKLKVSEVLDEMYGSTFSASSNIIGDGQVFIARVKSIHSAYISQPKNLLAEQFALLNAFLLHPLQKDGSFLSDRLQEAKRSVIASIKRMEDDPNSFCNHEALRLAGADQPLGIGSAYTIADVEAITLEDVNKTYAAMMANDQVDIIVFGDVDEGEVKLLADRYLAPLLRVGNQHRINYCLQYQEMEKKQYGYRDISQSYITSVYTTNTDVSDEDFKILRIANALFGQLPSSLLFQNVREKNSLCYSIYSAINPYDGMMGVSTGVDAKNIDLALTLINEQYENVKKGDFDEALLETSKKMVIHSLLSTGDDIDSVVALAYRNIVLKKEETLDALIAAIRQVNKDDVMRVMKKTQYVMSYILTQKGDQNENHSK